VVGCLLVVPERALDRPERGEVEDREDLVPDLPRADKPALGAGAGLFDRTEIRLYVGLVRAHHSFVLPLANLFRDVKCRRGQLERPLEMTGVVLERHQLKNDPCACVLIAARHHALLERL
jgi:hypothetical protein